MPNIVEQLEAYRDATKKLQYYADRISDLEARITNTTVPVERYAGWTGQYYGKRKRGYGWDISTNPDDFVMPKKVLALVNTKSSPNPHRTEDLLVTLVDKQIEYEQKALKLINQGAMLEKHIDENCKPNNAVALKYRYLSDMTYNQISEKMNYSVSQVRRLIDDGLLDLKRKMSRNEQK